MCSISVESRSGAGSARAVGRSTGADGTADRTLHRSKTARQQYNTNFCRCRAKFGDFFVHSEPGCGFFPLDKETAQVDDRRGVTAVRSSRGACELRAPAPRISFWRMPRESGLTIADAKLCPRLLCRAGGLCRISVQCRRNPRVAARRLVANGGWNGGNPRLVITRDQRDQVAASCGIMQRSSRQITPVCSWISLVSGAGVIG